MNYSIVIPAMTSSSASFAIVTDGFSESLQRHDGVTIGLDFNYDAANTTQVPPEEERSYAATIFLATILGTIVVLTITGNVLVIASVVLNKNLHTTTYYFIANLAIADLLLGTTVLPFSATLEVLQYWVFGQIFCDVWAAIDVLCCTASILSLCVISIDRYIGVTRPLQHSRIMRQTRSVYIIIFVWVLSITISVAPLIGWKEAPDPDPRVCTVTTQPSYVLFSVAGSFYIPCLIILVVYFRIYRVTVKYTRCLMSGAKMSKVDEENVVSLRIHTGRNVGTGSQRDTYQTMLNDLELDESSVCGTTPLHKKNSNKSKRNSRLTFSNKVAKFKREKKAAKTLGIVVGVFITCWLPFFLILPLDSLCPDCFVPPVLFKLFFWLGYCNSTMNPIIYTCSSMEFRRAFLAILSCRRCRRRPRVSLTELQLRARAKINSRQRALQRQRQQQYQQHELQSSLHEMSSSSSSPPGPILTMIKEPGGKLAATSITLPTARNMRNGGISHGGLSPDSLSSHSHGLYRSDGKADSFSMTKKHRQYQNGGSTISSRHGCSGLSLFEDNNVLQQQFQSRQSCQKNQEAVNGRVLTRDMSSFSSPNGSLSPDLHSLCLPTSGNHSWTTNPRPDNDKDLLSHFAKDGDVAGSDGLSCYSLAETISCSD